MRQCSLFLSGLMTCLMWNTVASAHFIFVVPEPAEHPKVIKLHLSELAEADDPAYLPKIEKAQVWYFNEEGKAVPLTLKIQDDELVGELPKEAADSPIVVNHTYGLMERKGEVVQLKYYAKAYGDTLPGNWSEVGKPQELPFEITPELNGREVVFTVHWEGKPLRGSQVTVESPVLPEKFQGETDAEGKFRVTLPKAGLYSVRARHVDKTPGELDGKPYAATTHFTTLTLPFTPPSLTETEKQWPKLNKGMTSFGAAVVGDDLYVYGGNYGGGHEYAEKDQSGDFIRLNLKNGTAWETLPGGPKLTGLAATSHDGKIYRVGGFTVKDVEGGKAQLNSQASVAGFDPAKGTWEELTPLPEPRSSHDIAVIGDTLYVVGGWSMSDAAGDNDRGWLTKAYSLDLKNPKAEWKAIAETPFHRRAISAAGHQGKLYVIGGMQKDGGPTTRVDVYDPATNTWSEGPAILGNSMDGFGSACADVNGSLVATTMSGGVQTLSSDGTRWEYQGQLKAPRFFHESPAWNGGVVVVGGAQMGMGKSLELEFVSPCNVNSKGKTTQLGQ